MLCGMCAVHKGKADEAATRCVTWRTRSMLAPAFWYLCQEHAEEVVGEWAKENQGARAVRRVTYSTRALA